jgi:large subunit ribosomal protein L22
MAERKKGTKPQSGAAASAPEQERSTETPAKRGAESASGKGGGSRQAKKAESKGRAQAEKKAESGKKGETAKKAPARKTGAKASAKTKESSAKSGGATATSKTADPEASEKATKAKAPAKKAEAKAKPAAKAKAKDKAEAPSRPVVNARARFVRIAPRKARLVADQVRGMALDDALALLRFHPRTAARDIAKLLDSAAANAEANHDLVADELRISDIRVDEGPTLRRYRPRALGRATKINKRTSHIRVALTPED